MDVSEVIIARIFSPDEKWGFEGSSSSVEGSLFMRIDCRTGPWSKLAYRVIQDS